MSARLANFVAFVCISVSACSPATLPTNVRTAERSGSRGTFVDSVDLSYPNAETATFAKLKLCVAENVSNNAITLTDSSGSHLTHQGLWHQEGNASTVQGGNAIKYVDDAQQVIITQGNLDAGSTALGTTREFVRFQLRASIEPAKVGLIFDRVEQAQQNAGTLPNTGFMPIGTWSGSGAGQAYAALQMLAGQIKSCTG